MDFDREKEWQAASKSEPCPVCKKDSWCRFTTDGTLANCRREARGGQAKTYSDGSTYYFHILRVDLSLPMPRRKSSPKRQTMEPAVSAPSQEAATGVPAANAQTETAEIARLHDAYSTLLSYDFVALNEKHTAAMLARGFNSSNLANRQYRTVTSSSVDRFMLKTRLTNDLGASGIAGVPGLAGDCQGLPCGGGILVPCRNASGQIFALKVRSDADDKTDTGIPKIYYLSSTKHGGPGAVQGAHVPLGISAQLDEVRVTEGEIKADLATDLSGTPTISFPGVSSWRTILPVLQQLQVKTVRLAFDADASNNLLVATAQLDCATELSAAGYVVKVERWAASDGKGIDDVLAANRPVILLEGEEALEHCNCCVQAAQQVAETKQADQDEAGKSNSKELLKRALDAYDKGVAVFFADQKLLYALARVACLDPPTYAAICEELKARGMGTMNFRRAMKPILAKAAAEVEPEFGRAEKGGFYIAGGRLCRTKQTPYGPLTMDLCNFVAEIVDETTLDDGAELKVVLGISGSLAEGRPLPRIEVPAEKFHEPQKWMLPGWGSDAIAWPGEVKAISAAIQALSERKTLARVFVHTGWRKFGDSWAYLHAGGAIGVDDAIKVSLPDSLARVELTPAATQEQLRTAVQASLAILKLTPDNPAITYSLLGTVYRSPLGLADHSLYLVGRSGTYKTETASLAQQHFGAGFDSRHLPANWSSTGNSLEGLLFHAKDVPVVIDDYAPQAGDVSRLNRAAEQVFRAQGNSAGRARMKHDGTLRQPKPPRGTVIATGEDVPTGQSILARLNIQEFAPGDVDLKQLTKCQENGALGLYSQAMCGYIAWLAPSYDNVLAEKKLAVEKLRAQAIEDAKTSGLHARTPGIVAEVHYGLTKFLAFAESCGAISAAERQQFELEGWNNLMKSSATQADGQEQCEPAAQFIRLVTSAVATGRAHLVNYDGRVPVQPQAWGWRLNEVPVNTGGCREEWRPQGKKIGWLLEGQATLLLDADASYAAAQQLAEETGSGFAIKPVTLGKRLNERGFLYSTGCKDGGRETLKVRHTCEGRRVAGFEMKLETLCDVTSQSADAAPEPTTNPETCPDSTDAGPVGQVGQVLNGYQAAPVQETFTELENAF